MRKATLRQQGFSAVIVMLSILLLGVIAASTWLVYRHHHTVTPNDTAATSTSKSTKQQTSSNTAQAQPDPYAGWKIYTSATEKATFKYPSTWALSAPKVSPADTNADTTGITSPSGSITITWNSGVGGFGNEHGASYPYNTVVERTPITSASGLYVVSGITTLDGTTYHPWIAVQDANGISQSGVAGAAVIFHGKHAINTSTSAPAIELFSTSGLGADQNTPTLTQAQATAWFSSAEAQQVKLILLSFSDPN